MLPIESSSLSSLAIKLNFKKNLSTKNKLAGIVGYKKVYLTMAKIHLSKEELVLKLKEQLSSIEQLCEIYDGGKHFISQDIAVKIRVIFHTTNESKSLINHLKLQHVPLLCTCSSYNSKNLMKSHLGLIAMQHTPEYGWSYVPMLTKTNSKNVNQENWWNSKKVLIDSNGNVFTRSKLVKAVANQDGGAHVGVSLNSDYYDLTRGTSSGWVFMLDNGKQIQLNPVPPSIRQMAFELLESFRNIDIARESKIR